MGVGMRLDDIEAIGFMLNIGVPVVEIAHRLNLMNYERNCNSGAVFTEESVQRAIRNFDLDSTACKPSFELNGVTVDINPKED